MWYKIDGWDLKKPNVKTGFSRKGITSVQRNKKRKKRQKNKSIFFFFDLVRLSRQNKTCHGWVSESNGKPKRLQDYNQ